MKPRTLKEIVEESPFWDAEELISNLDAELDRIEHGIGHMVWTDLHHPVSRCLALLPITPRFRVKESEETLGVAVDLPNVPEELMSVKVDRTGIEVSACTSDPVCRPYYVKVECREALDPDSAELRHSGITLEVDVEKVKKKRVKVR
jgi:HSP20 family molecular chaperone IbpA